jgi:molybdopterin synthase catalytic subunit
MNVLFRISGESLDRNEVDAFLHSSFDGAVVVFEGIIRSHNNQKEVTSIQFDSYDAMVLEELHRIATEMFERFAISKVALIHRTGSVVPGDMVVIAGVAAPHRAAAFQACADLMNQLKSSVPIWKKEIYDDGQVWISPTP